MRVVRNIFSYSAVNIVSAAVPFFLLPILTAHLSPSEFGELSLVVMLQTLLIPLVLISFNGLVSIEYSKLDQDQFSSLVAAVMWLPIIGACVMVLFLIIFQGYVAKLFDISNFWVIASVFVVLLQALPTLISSLFQAEQNPVAFGVFKVSMTLVNFMLSLFFVISLNYGWEGRMWGMVVAYALFSAISLAILKRKGMLNLYWDTTHIHHAFKFGIPVIPHVLSGTLLAMVDRLFQVNMLEKADVGMYSVAFQVATAVMIIMSSINQAWSPHLFEQLNRSPSNGQKKKLIAHTYRIMAVMLVVAICFIVAIPLVFNLFIANAYHDGVVVAMIISVAMLFQGFYFMVTNYIFYVKKTHLLSFMTLISAAIVMLLNYVLIPKFGILGSACAMVISWLILFLLAWLLAQRVYPMPWFSTWSERSL